MEKLFMIELSIKDKSNNYLVNFKDIYRKINQLKNLRKNYGLLIIISILNINLDLAIARERISRLYTRMPNAFGRGANFGSEIGGLSYSKRSTLIPSAFQYRCF
jgi:hypothetical protein